MQFQHVVCGGTFDHFHLGHKKLLDECIRQGKKVTVGITTRAMTRHKAYHFSIQPYITRVKNVQKRYPSAKILKLADIFGSTLQDSSIDAICVTKDTYSGAELINTKREEAGMKPLSIIIVPFIFDQNNEKIASERIRQGVQDWQGSRYDTYLFSKEKLHLPNSLKAVLRKPLGRVISSFSQLSSKQIESIKRENEKRGYLYTCAVGDMVTYELKKRGLSTALSVIDGITQRKALNDEIIRSILEKERIYAPNEKGTIQNDAIKAISSMFNIGHNKAIKQLYINGEEDLLTLIMVLLAPLGAHVWYGQQGVGAIDVRVTEKKKQTVYNLLRQFV